MTISSRITDLVTAIATALNNRQQTAATGYDIAKLNGYTGTQAQWLADFSDPGNTDYATQFNNQLGAVPAAGAASESQTGVTQLSTAAEAAAATISTKALSPARALDWIGGTLAQNVLANITNSRRGTDAQRLALSGSQLLDGMLFYSADTGWTWKYLAAVAGWRVWNTPGNIKAQAVTLPSNVSEWNQANDFSVREGRALWNFSLTSTTNITLNGTWATVNSGFTAAAANGNVHTVADYYDPTSGYGVVVMNLYNGSVLSQSIKNANSGGNTTGVHGTMSWRVTD